MSFSASAIRAWQSLCIPIYHERLLVCKPVWAYWHKGLQTLPIEFCQALHGSSRNPWANWLSHWHRGDIEGQFYKLTAAEILGALASEVVCLQHLSLAASYWSLLRCHLLRDAFPVHVWQSSLCPALFCLSPCFIFFIAILII